MKYVVIDIETNGLKRFNAKINLIGIYVPEHNWYGIYGVSDMVEGLTLLYTMMNQGYKFIWQNGKFDTLFIDHHYNLMLPIDEDVMLLSYVLDMGDRKSLDYLVEKHFGQPSWDIPLKEKMKDTPETRQYLKLDLYWTWMLFQKLHAQLNDRTTKLYRRLVLRSYNAYRVVEKNGIQLNMNKLNETLIEFTIKRDQLLEELNSQVTEEINWNSTKQLRELLYDKLMYPILGKTPKGEPSTGAAFLKRLNKMGYTLMGKLLEYRDYAKSVTTLNGWLEDQVDGRLYPTFNIDTTRTGRTSSSGPNLQQVPRDPRLRNIFTARPGYTLLEADQSQVELRIAAVVANEPNMKAVYLRGEDLHTETARVITGNQTPTKNDRTLAKPVNFGFLYGMMAKTFVPYAEDNYDVVFSLEEATIHRDRFFSAFPGLLDWYNREKESCLAYGGVYTMFGRFRELPNIYSDKWWLHEEAKRQAINTPVQSAASDILLGGLIDIVESDLEVIPVGTVHDSILLELPNHLAEELRVKIVKMMENPTVLKEFDIKLDIPLKVDAELGDWGSK